MMITSPVPQVNLNTALSSELAPLEGIGVLRAEWIIAARPFTIAHDLVSRGILTEQAFRLIAASLTLAAA